MLIKHMKSCSTSWVIRAAWNKSIIRCQHSAPNACNQQGAQDQKLVRMWSNELLILLGKWLNHMASGNLSSPARDQTHTACVGSTQFQPPGGRGHMRESTLENSFGRSSKVKFTTQLLSGVYSREANTPVHTETWMLLFIIALIHNSPKVEAISMSVICWTDKENVQ